jgi:hypothetical protein
MRFTASRKRYKFGSRAACSRGGIRSQQVQAERRIAEACGEPPTRRPGEGTLLRTIIVVDHLAGTSTAIEIRQAERKNQIIPAVFGRAGNPVGWDKVMRRLRAVCVYRWLEP